MASASNTASILGIVFIVAIIAYAVYKLSSIIKNPIKSLIGAGTSTSHGTSSIFNITSPDNLAGLPQVSSAVNQGGISSWTGTATGGLVTGLQNTPFGIALAIANRLITPYQAAINRAKGVQAGTYRPPSPIAPNNTQVYANLSGGAPQPTVAGINTLAPGQNPYVFGGWSPPAGAQQRYY